MSSVQPPAASSDASNKRFEKLLKRLKPLFDEKIKMKQRLKGLEAFLEQSTESDEIKVFQENEELIFKVLEIGNWTASDMTYSLNSCYDSISNISIFIKHNLLLHVQLIDMELLERNANISSKDASIFFEDLQIFQKILKFTPMRVQDDPRRDKITSILEMLTSRSNHVKIRQKGLELIHLIIKIQSVPDPDVVRLYSSAVAMDAFKAPATCQVNLDYFSTIGSDETCLIREYLDQVSANVSDFWSCSRCEPTVTDFDAIPQNQNTSVIIPREGSELSNNVEIFNDLIGYIVSLAEESVTNLAEKSFSGIQSHIYSPDTTTVKKFWNLFKEKYLRFLFPALSKAVGIKEIQNGVGFEFCPLDLLSSLSEYLAKISAVGKLIDTKDAARLLLSFLLSSDYESFEVFHEVLRQSFLSQNLSSSIYIITQWFLSPLAEGHPFLKRGNPPAKSPVNTNSPQIMSSLLSSPASTLSAKTSSIMHLPIAERVNDHLVNQMARRYIRYFRCSIIEGRKKDNDIHAILIKEALQFYRFLGSEKIHLLDSTTWKLILSTLLEFFPLLGGFESPDITEVVAETVLVTCIRSKIKDTEFWIQIQDTFSKFIDNSGIVTSWASLTVQFTYIMAESVYGIGLVALKEENGRHKRYKTKNREQGSISTSILLSSPGVSMSPSTPDPLRKQIAARKLPSGTGDDHLDHLRASQSSKSKASSLSEKNSNEKTVSIDELNVDHSTTTVQLMSDSLQFSQMKELKELFSKDSLWVWKNLITCVGPIHSIKETEIHYDAINCIVTIWGILEKIRILQPCTQVEVPSLYDFVGIVFKAVMMPDEYLKSKSLAAGYLGRIMCKRQEFAVDRKLISLFYQFTVKLFSGSTNNVSLAFLSSVSRLYSVSLPGVTITIPAVMRFLKSVTGMKGPPELAIRASFSILASLVALEKHYRPLLGTTQRSPLSETTIINYNPPNLCETRQVFIDLKYGLFNILSSSLKFHSENRNEDYCEILIWNLAVLYLEEGTSTHQRDDMFQNDLLFVLLEYVSCKQLPLVSAAADGLNLLADNYERINLHQDTSIHIIDRLAWGISENLSIDEHAKRKDLISNVTICSILFQCLLEWIMAVPSHLMANPNISLRISEVIEEAFHVAAVGIDGVEREREKLQVEGEIIATNKQEAQEIIKIYERLRESAQNTLAHLTHHLDNFSPIYGPSMMNSILSDPINEENFDHVDCHYFSFNDNTILTLFEDPNENKLRIMTRNITGKYAWELKAFYHELDEVEEGGHNCSKKNVFSRPKSLLREPSRLTALSSESGDMESKASDPLEAALLNIQLNHPECHYIVPSNEKSIFHQDLIEIQLKIEQEIYNQRIRPDPEREPEPRNEKLNAYEMARLYLALTDQLSFDYLREGKMYLLSKSTNLLRDLRVLDKKYSREVAKFAVLYVGPGQEDEGTILRNGAASLAYNEFVLSLGWPVQLSQHHGYAGGLDATVVNDGVAIYYCTSTVEIIFHDVTRIPTDLQDPKQLKKKRHVGNDHVHIIWNEHSRDYKWDTIGGDFGNAQICITPLSNGLFAIDTYRDDLVRPFGPLQSRSVVSKECLGTLVRSTALNAYRNALCQGAPKGMEAHPFTTRKQLINQISTRHKVVNDTFEKHMSLIIGGGGGGGGSLESGPRVRNAEDKARMEKHLSAIIAARKQIPSIGTGLINVVTEDV